MLSQWSPRDLTKGISNKHIMKQTNLNLDLGQVICNFQFGSKNRKVGNIIQTWFLPKSYIEAGKIDTDLQTLKNYKS